MTSLQLVANFVQTGDQGVKRNGEKYSKYEAVRSHRVRLMQQTFYWNAATWYRVFKGSIALARFSLDDCQATHRNFSVFLALLPDMRSQQLDDEREKQRVIQLVSRYAKKLVQEGRNIAMGLTGSSKTQAIQQWLTSLT